MGQYIDCSLSDLQLLDNTGNSIGSSIYFTNMSSDSYTIVNNCYFENNSADLGGAIILDGCRMTVKYSKFVNNTSDIGAAIVSLCNDDDEINYLINNTFYHNNATIGGAIYWESNGLGMSNNDFIDNVAKYGNPIASRPQNLELIKEPYRMLNESEVFEDNLVCNLEHGLSFQAALVDFHGEIVSYGYDGFPAILSCESSDVKMIGEDIKIYPKNGIIEFNDLLFICNPGSEIVLSLRYSGKIFNFYRDKSYDIPEMKITISTRSCQKGEHKTSSWCEYCPEGKFSLDPSDDCEMCPQNAYCYGGYQIAPLEGYWHGSNESSIIYSCPNPSACRGEIKDDIGYISLVGECAEGYRGNLCQPCDHKYSSSERNECKKSPSNQIVNGAEIFGIFIALIALIVYIVYSSLKSAYEPKSAIAIYFRILINYLQMIMLVGKLNLNWPWYIDYWLTSQGYPGEVPMHIVSIDCYLMEGDDEDSYKTIYFKKMIMIVIFPAALGTVAFIVWLLIAISERKWKLLKNELIATFCILLFLILPSITDYMFSIFSCTYIYDHLYLVRNMDIKCWENDHLFYSLTVALPGIILWTIGIPTCVFLYLYKRKYKLHKLDIKLRLGFLYSGYRKSTYLWEFILLIRKLMIICLTVFLTTEAIEIQVVSCFSIFAIFYWIQYKYCPFEHENINKTELGGNFVVLITTWCGLFYMSNRLNKIASLIFFGLILLSNAYFVFKWIEAMTIELKQIIIKLFPCIKSYFDVYTLRVQKKSENKPIFSFVENKDLYLAPEKRIKNSIDLSILKLKDNIN